jgi:hypothetical protein
LGGFDVQDYRNLRVWQKALILCTAPSSPSRAQKRADPTISRLSGFHPATEFGEFAGGPGALVPPTVFPSRGDVFLGGSSRNAFPSGGYLACVVVVLCNTNGLEGTEFSGGWLTGPLLSMADIGTVLFVLAFVVTFRTPRIAAALGIASSLLYLPLYLYFLAPVPFSEIFGWGHQFKVQPNEAFHWDPWATGGVLTIAVTTYGCLRGLAVTTGPRIQEQR